MQAEPSGAGSNRPASSTVATSAAYRPHPHGRVHSAGYSRVSDVVGIRRGKLVLPRERVRAFKALSATSSLPTLRAGAERRQWNCRSERANPVVRRIGQSRCPRAGSPSASVRHRLAAAAILPEINRCCALVCLFGKRYACAPNEFAGSFSPVRRLSLSVRRCLTPAPKARSLQTPVSAPGLQQVHQTAAAHRSAGVPTRRRRLGQVRRSRRHDDED